MLVYLIVAGAVLLACLLLSNFGSASTSRPRAAVIVFSHFPQDPRPRREAESLLKNGFEVDIFCLRREQNDQLCEDVGGAKVYRLPLRRRRSGKLRYAFEYGAFLTASFLFLGLRSFRLYRLVHIHNMPDVLVFSAIVPRILGAKVILDLHDPVPEVYRVIYDLKKESLTVRALQTVEKWSIAFADLVLTPNLAFREIFVSRGCPPEKIRIVMNSPDESIFNIHDYSGRVKRPGYNLMFHGTLLKRNGLSLAVAAVAKLRERIPCLKLLIYGEQTPYISELMREVERLDLLSTVEYLGYSPLHQVPAAISAIDVGLVPNLANPFNNINLPTRIFEYLALAKLPIVPRTKGIQDYFQEEEILFFQAGDVEDLANKIEWAFLNPVKANEILQRGRKVYEKHRWETEEKNFLNLVRGLSRFHPPLKENSKGLGRQLEFNRVTMRSEMKQKPSEGERAKAAY